MNDMQAVREAAERCGGLFECDIVDIENMSVECVTDLLTLARDRHRLTDPTPLTVERLVECGGKCVGDDAVRFGDLCFTICEVEGIIGVMVGKALLPRKLWPRTVGELRQLLLRLEGQS